MQNKNNEKNALLFGLLLIIIVFTITVAKSGFFSSKKNSAVSSQQSVQENGPDYNTISANDLQMKILKRENLTLLDIRQFQDYANEHILDVINVTPDSFPVADKIDAKKPVVIIATNTQDGNIQKVVDELKKANFLSVSVLAGGMESWKQLVGNTVTYGNPESFTDQSKVLYTTTDKVKSSIESDPKPNILDVRSPDDFAKGHIEGAKNIPFEDLEKRRLEIPTNTSIVVVGINELEEFQASVQIYDMVLKIPFVMKGAMPEWETKKFALVK